MLLLLKAIDPDLKGKVGIKLTFENYRDREVKINPDLIKPLVSQVKGTLIDSNYFDSARNAAASHLETANRTDLIRSVRSISWMLKEKSRFRFTAASILRPLLPVLILPITTL